MRTTWLRICVLVALGPALAAVVPARSDERQTNKLQGIVVFKEDGRPAAGVPVAMAQGEKGSIYFDNDGFTAYGDRDLILRFFAKPNSQHFSEAVTDSTGRFTLAGFAVSDQPCTVVAGAPESGYALRTGVRRQDFSGTAPLKLELEQPAFLNVTPPRAPAKSLQIMLNVALALTPPPAETAAMPDTGAAKTERMHFTSTSPRTGARDKPVRIGPLPGGHKYKVTATAYGGELSYQPKLFERAAAPAPGATLDVVLENAEGVAVSGTITDVDEKPLAAVNVMVKTADGLVIGALTDQTGKYELRGVPPGTHKLELLRHAKRLVPG